jgi:hypothetical protein
MVIKADFSALKRTKWYEYAIRFVLGGLITAIAGMIAKSYGPVIGGLFLAFPAIFPAAVTLIAKHERQKKSERGLSGDRRGRGAAAVESAGAVMGSLGLTVFACITWLFLPGYNPILVLAGAMVAWIAASAAFWTLRKYRHAFGIFRKRSSTLSRC